MTLSLTIANAISGLRVAQHSLDTVSQNVSNAQTPGYTRKVASQESMVVGGVGLGVNSTETRRAVDTQLQRELMHQDSNLSNQTVKESYLKSIEELQGRPDDATSLSSTFTQLQSSFETLSASPESRTSQIDAINKAGRLCDQLHDVSAKVLSLRNQAQVDIANAVSEVNAHIQNVAALNQQITSETAAEHSTVDLEDHRDQEVRELAKLMDVTTVLSPGNQLDVSTRSGQTLVDRKGRTFEFSATLLNESSYYRKSPPGTISAITDKETGQDITAQFAGGRIGALLELRDTIMPRAQGQLDEFAQKTAARFAAQGLTLFTDRAGTLPLVPADLPGNYVGFAARIQVNPATAESNFVRYGDAGFPATPSSSASIPVSNGVITRVLDYTFGNYQDAANTPHPAYRTTGLGPDINAGIESGLPATATLRDYIQNLVAYQGQSHADANAALTQAQDVKNALETRSNNYSGVNLDTEIGQLTILQRSYGASAQVLKISQQLLDEIINLAR
jgi:flagellar hook-associated protein 1 FlgK